MLVYFYAKEVPPQGRNDLSLHPFHSPMCTFTPLFNFAVSFQSLICSDSHSSLQPQVLRLGKARASGAPVPKEGPQNHCESLRLQDLFLKMSALSRGRHEDPSPPSPRKTQRPSKNDTVHSIWFP